MEKVFLIVISSAVILCAAYFVLIASYCMAWVRTKPPKFINTDTVFVSVIIAARNEEDAILNCLNALAKQSYPSDKFEVIVVDDASTDTTKQLILEHSKKYPNVKLLDGGSGKKDALKKGIEVAQGELIVTTDADCASGELWLSSIVSFYKETDAKMIIGPVCFQNEKSLFEKMQSLEFMALISCGGASLFYDKAIMCNGANLAYPKKVFEELKGFDGIDEKASGDDILLMYKIKERYPQGLKFLKSEEAVVYTAAKKDLKSFIDQRKRWASKGFRSLNRETKVVSLLIYCFNFMLVFLPLAAAVCLRNSAFYHIFMEICLILMGIKCFIDFLLLFLSASFFKKKKLLIYFLPEQIIYIIYVVLIGLIGTLGKYEWKGRQLN